MKKYSIGIMGLLMILLAQVSLLPAQWSWLHTYALLPHQSAEGNKRGFFSCAQRSMPFNHLVFSWNALRPCKGYFSFWVEVQDAVTQEWYVCHKMVEWGACVQRSFLSESRHGTGYFHVRLELPKNRFAHAFKVHVKSHERAPFQYLKYMFINTVNFNFFNPEKTNGLQQLPSVYVKGVARQSQMVLAHPRAHHLCSPTSTALLTSYIVKRAIDPLQFALKSYDPGLDAYGSWPFNTAHAFEHAHGTALFYVKHLTSFRELHHYLQQQHPVIVSVRGPLIGAAGPYAQGHLLLVVGYSQGERKVYCHDPAFESNTKTVVTYQLKDFLEAWERSRRLAYIAERLS